jgi:hypothetical protein
MAMTEIRGRPLAACVVIVSLWTATRIGLMDSGGIIRLGKAQQIPEATQASETGIAIKQPEYSVRHRIGFPMDSLPNWHSPAIFAHSENLGSALGVYYKPLVSRNSGHITAPQPISIGNKAALPIAKSGDTYAPTTQQPSPSPPSQSLMPQSPFLLLSENRLAFYAYSFWRPGSSSNLDAVAPQYGGSQSGLIATYRLTKKEQPDVSLLMRAAITPGRFADKEFAVGLRTKPIASLPITVSAERRFRANSRDQYAVYAAGSVDNIALLLGVKGRGFAQAGIVPEKNPNLFFDAGIRAEHSIHNIGNTDLSFGAGAWAGGQRGASRFDVGPTLSANIKLGTTRLDVSADWRFRVKGDAQPKHGPAITISTGF